MSEFSIDIKIAPKGDGLKKIGDDLEKVEKKADQAGDAIAAIGADATAASRKAADAFDWSTSALAELERAALEAAKAEDDFFAAVQETTSALKQQGDALGDTNEKTKETGKTLADQAQAWVKQQRGVMEVVTAVGKLGMAMGALNQAVQLGQTAWAGLGTAVAGAEAAMAKILGRSSTPAEWRAFIAGGGLREASSGVRNLLGVDTMMNPDNDRATGIRGLYEDKEWEEAGGWNSVGGFGIDAVFNARVSQLQEQATAAAAEEQRQRDEDAAYDDYQRQARLEEQKAAIEAQKTAWEARVAAADKRRSRREPTEDLSPTMWDDIEGQVSSAGAAALAYLDHLTKIEAQHDAMQSGAEVFGEQMLSLWNQSSGMVEAFVAETDDLGPAFERVAKAGIDWSKELQAQLEGPVGGAIDGLLDGLVRWEMGWKEWGAAALQEIAKVMARLLLLQGVQAAVGAGGGGSSLGQLLWGALGGGAVGGDKKGGTSSRMAPGDTFGGGAGSTSGAVWREAVNQRRAGGGEQGAGQTINVKVVNVSDSRAAAMEALQTQEAERLIVNTINNNRGALGLQGR
jgi:hypothetical protein